MTFKGMIQQFQMLLLIRKLELGVEMRKGRRVRERRALQRAKTEAPAWQKENTRFDVSQIRVN